MPSQRTRLLLVLLALSAFLHFFRLSEPRSVVFDEVHFGGFINAYCGSGGYFFDIHPPHGKLLVAGAAALGGYRGEQPFREIHEPITEVSPGVFRFVPALAGTLLPAVIFGLLLQLGASSAAALLGGLATLLDNALLAQTRIIALDGILLLTTFGALSCCLVGVRCAHRLRRTAFALLSGLLAGLAVGTKFTGLLALGLIAGALLLELPGGPARKRLRVAASYTVWILSGAVAVYAAGWVLHFALLTEPGPGYEWARPTGSVLTDILATHRRMLTANYGLIASHPYASPWWSWPLMLRPVFYWEVGDASLYFLGNPVLWWGTTLGLLGVGSGLVLLRVTNIRLPEATPAWPRSCWIPLLGYLGSLAPLALIPRPLFLYHYLMPLLFGVCLVLLWLDHVGWTRIGSWREQRTSFHGATGLLILGFLAAGPLTLAYVRFPAYRALVFDLFPGWR